MWEYKLQGLSGFGWLPCKVFWNPSPRAKGNKPKPGKHDLLQLQSRCPKKETFRNEGNPECKEIFANQNTHKQVISKTNKKLTMWWYFNKVDSVKISNPSVVQFHSDAQSCPTLRPHGPQHAQLLCPPSTPRACSNSCPSSWWCHPTISSSVIPFSSCLQPFPHQRLYQRVGSSHQVTKRLAFQLQHQSFQWTFRTAFL